MAMNGAQITTAETPEQIEQVRRLFREYADGTGACECFHEFAAEIAGLPGPYAPPTGRLLLADVDSRPAGCVALRSLENRICEMKRLYVRPEFRGRHLGRQLAQAIIADARRIGFRAMRLDTLPSMMSARGLYQALAFRPIPRYNDTPGEGVIHLEFGLTEHGLT